ncbi:MAG: hypothetical protein JWN48_5426, partial [Myxococcaceae bacterium]|nr:hypothetical protein [Myxococcaceae bacterium]
MEVPVAQRASKRCGLKLPVLVAVATLDERTAGTLAFLVAQAELSPSIGIATQRF